jgi:trk system potassium uptake protein TrkA
MSLKLPSGVLAVALVRDDDLHIPTGQTRIRVDDKITFMGTQRALRQVESRFFKDVVEKVRFVTIIGGGNVGLAVAKRLEAEGDLELKLIEESLERCEFLASELPKTLVLQGDGTDLELLELEQIYRSDVLVSVTSNDETNLLCSLIGRETEIPKIITRVDNPSNFYLFESVGINVPLSPRATAIKTVLASLRDTEIPLLGTFEQGRGNVVEVTVPPTFTATRVKDLDRIDEFVIGAVVRNYTTFVPGGEDEVRPGDRLVVFHTSDSAGFLEALA